MIFAIVILSITLCLVCFFFIRYHLKALKIQKDLAKTILDLQESKKFHINELQERLGKEGIDFYDRKRNR